MGPRVKLFNEAHYILQEINNNNYSNSMIKYPIIQMFHTLHAYVWVSNLITIKDCISCYHIYINPYDTKTCSVARSLYSIPIIVHIFTRFKINIVKRTVYELRVQQKIKDMFYLTNIINYLLREKLSFSLPHKPYNRCNEFKILKQVYFRIKLDLIWI